MIRWRSAVAVAAVLGLLLAGGAGTAAMWRAQASIGTGTISTGTLVVLAGDGSTASAVFPVAALNTASLAPGGYVQAPLTISNAGSTNMAVTLVSADPGTLTGAAAVLAAYLTLTVTQVATAAGCPVNGGAASGTLLYSGRPGAAVTAANGFPLAPSTASPVCVRIALDTGAPQAGAGGSVSLAFGFRGDQRR